MAKSEEITISSGQPLASVQVVGINGGGAQEPAQTQDALNAEKAQLRSALAALQQGAGKLAELSDQITGELEQQLLDLAVEIAGKVLMQEIQAERYNVEPLVKEALSHFSNTSQIVVHLHPEDYAQCELAKQSQDTAEGGGVRFVSDPGVRRAQCILETSDAMVESSVESHLEDVAETLKRPE
ncbi:MAG: FliH/SctL family protein [Planctomycetota bacterium]|jgi:flagellar assembly protein FliH